MAEPWKTHGPDFNAWNSDFDKFSALLNSVKDEPWWIKDFDLKYLNVRIDTRDNGFLLLSDEKDGKRERISPDRVVAAIESYIADFPSRDPAPQTNMRGGAEPTKRQIEAAIEAYEDGSYLNDEQVLVSVIAIVRAAMEAETAQEQMPGYLAADIVKRIADVSTATGAMAGEPAIELAGQIISLLAVHPEHIDRFMAEGSELFIDGTFNPEHGSMTYRANSGAILHPSVLRQKNGSQQ